MTERDLATEQADEDRIRAASDAWAAGTGGPFGLLADGAGWTITGDSPVARTCAGRADSVDAVIDPFDARMSAPLRPTVRGLHADGDRVVVLFDAEATARDGVPYRNTCSWHLRLAGGRSSRRSRSSTPSSSPTSGRG